MPRVAWTTDIHWNFVDPPGREAFIESLRGANIDRLWISGDLAESKDVAATLLELADRVAVPLDFVLGNHDFYHGSILEVRERMAAMAAGDPRLNYLSYCGVVPLSDDAAVLGHDGWGDARAGDYEQSPVLLADFGLIGELAGQTSAARRTLLQALGDEAARHVRHVLPAAAERYPRLFLLTHVPPFREACWYRGRVSDNDWAPHFTCVAVGEAILEVMSSFPQCQLTVLCGHTHSGGSTRPIDNVHVLTGEAAYGHPAVNRVFEL